MVRQQQRRWRMVLSPTLAEKARAGMPLLRGSGRVRFVNSDQRLIAQGAPHRKPLFVATMHRIQSEHTAGRL